MFKGFDLAHPQMKKYLDVCARYYYMTPVCSAYVIYKIIFRK